MPYVVLENQALFEWLLNLSSWTFVCFRVLGEVQGWEHSFFQGFRSWVLLLGGGVLVPDLGPQYVCVLVIATQLHVLGLAPLLA